ncbi:hypothetical protein NDU88_001729 [Pleurodeles waltl]|uniref:Uncharacterized protein n=1 Tax=Pleurodeles waltl TaxID=8319 RepID=A0AAV7P517_PLEWA|nr:hypothetical protein NDU88_001729 [Pleurodeles waltl]
MQWRQDALPDQPHCAEKEKGSSIALRPPSLLPDNARRLEGIVPSIGSKLKKKNRNRAPDEQHEVALENRFPPPPP